MLAVPLRAQGVVCEFNNGGWIDQTLPSYPIQNLSLWRLRALDDGHGRPETKVYDDLGTTINSWANYGLGFKLLNEYPPRLTETKKVDFRSSEIFSKISRSFKRWLDEILDFLSFP